ncbi:MAG: hypothetical protein RML95_14140, partial [Anaerolineae bacterium]|nr:hypothetical protein [Anaerolineae bacterium]
MNNGIFTAFARFLVLSWIVLSASCTTTDRYIGIRRFEYDVTSQSALGLLAVRHGVWIAWSGGLSAPDLYVQPIGTAQVWRFPISGAPNQLRLLPLAERRLALLWLESSAGTVPRLQVATVEADGTLRRAPFEIGAAQRYTALPTPSGGILAFTISDESLSVAQLDRLGRPYGKFRVAESAHMVAATLDQRNQLHLLWLAPSDGQLWQLLYVSFDLGLLDQSVPRLPAPTLLAVLRLADSEYFESFSAVADAEHVYVVWNVVSVSRESESARLEGLFFPLNTPLRSRSLNLSALPTNLRHVSLPLADGVLSGAPTLVGSREAQHIVFGALAVQGIFRLQQVAATSENEILSSDVAAALSANNALHLAWLVQSAQGKAGLRYAV